ncbi:MAG: hypothetical protein JNL11_07915 [Bdellovibrionaceae bacterium]|nr:hypothetical protein [Pseudobdellovibrionaceae bacterium]
MNLPTTKIILAVFLLQLNLGYTQTKGNGGVICDSDIRAHLYDLAKEEPSTSGFNISNYDATLSSFYLALATGERPKAAQTNAPLFILQYSGQTAGSNPVMITNSMMCREENKENIKRNLKEFVTRIKFCEKKFRMALNQIATEESGHVSKSDHLVSTSSNQSRDLTLDLIFDLARGEVISTEVFSREDRTTRPAITLHQRTTNNGPISVIVYDPEICTTSKDNLKSNLKMFINRIYVSPEKKGFSHKIDSPNEINAPNETTPSQ